MPKLEPLYSSTQLPFTTRDMQRFYHKYKRLILGTFLVTTLLTIPLYLMFPSIYKIQARVVVKPEQQDTPSFFTGLTSSKDSPYQYPVSRKLATEAELLQSRLLIEDVVRELDLKYNQVYRTAYTYYTDPLIDKYDNLMRMIGATPNMEKRGFNATVVNFQKGLDVSMVSPGSSGESAAGGAGESSNLIDIVMTTPEPVLGQRALAVLLEKYVNFETNRRAEAGHRAYDIVKERLDRARKDVDEAQEELQSFLGKSGLSLHATKAAAGISNSSTSFVDSKVNTSSMASGRANRASRSSTLTSGRDENSVEQLKAALLDRKTQLADLRGRYGISGEIDQLERSVAQLESQLKHEVNRSAGDQGRLIELDRNLRTKEDSFLEIQRKLDQINVFLDTNQEQLDTRLTVERAFVPWDSEWKKTLVIAIGVCFGGLLLGFVFAAYFEYTDRRFRSAYEVMKTLGVPVLATLPQQSGAVGLQNKTGRGFSQRGKQHG